MLQLAFDTLQSLTDIPFNIWPWLLLIITPILISSAKPHDDLSWRLCRIIIATIIGYVLINLTLHTHRELDWKELEQCRVENPVFGENIHPKCEGIVNIADGASYVFYFVLGWVPAAAYAGFWEFWWRRKYAFIIRSLGKKYKGKWFSTVLIICSVPVWLFTALIFMTIIANFFLACLTNLLR